MHATCKIERAKCAHIDHIDIDDAEFQRRDLIDAMWQLCPRYRAFEPDDAWAVLDGVGRPIFRCISEGPRTILAPSAKYNAIGSLKPLYHDPGITPNEQGVRDFIRSYISHFQLAPELRRRHALQQRGKLTGGWRVW